ncbi:F-box DNA helicase 1-like [Penaeus japonicus]|nr:F-box DNA helicase 1-like [Penaeus japonicus]
MNKCSRKQNVSMSQDGQLKCWQLKKPEISEYSAIMIDGAEDMNAAILDIFRNQKCARVVVGDPHQEIFSFKGVVNAFQMIRETHAYRLTQSFRFGPKIASVAQCVLKNLTELQGQTLVGGRRRDFVRSGHMPMPSPDARLTRAYLARTHVGLYKWSLEMCYDEKYSSKSMGFAGGLEAYEFDDVLDIYNLSKPEKQESINKDFFRKFRTVSDLDQFATKIDDIELSNKIKMFKHSGDKTPRHIKRLKEKCSSKLANSDIIFSTVHRAKGLEFDWVTLLDDFNLGRNQEDGKGEWNILYVAITRAKQYLDIDSGVLDDLGYNE